MKWSYGVTTVPERFEQLLPRTLNSLALAGFNKPRLFVDGPSPNFINVPTTSREVNIGAMANWYLAAAELYAREPEADRYAIFQDDFVTYRNLKEYLEKCEYPDRGYWNLATFPSNAMKKTGWYVAPYQLGKGAVALIFNRTILQTLLSCRKFVDRVSHRKDGIDGGIIDALKEHRIKEYVHGPSLVYHTGLVSSLRHPPYLEFEFLGEDYDALNFLNGTR